jgi:hypothetical protein
MNANIHRAAPMITWCRGYDNNSRSRHSPSAQQVSTKF